MASFNKDKVFGALLVGSYANTVLYTLETVAVIQYHLASKRTRNRDSLLLKAVVYFTFVVDTICTGVSSSLVYLYTVTHWGDFNYLNPANTSQFRSEAVSTALTGITAVIVQSFLIHRYWRMSQNYLITSVLVLSILAALGGALGTTITQLVFSTSGGMSRLMLCAKIWLITSAVTDIAIAAALLWKLSQIKSSFRKTQSLIHRLMASTISTGTVTSAFAMIILILFITERDNNLSAGAMFCLGRVYALTMLYNLNYRGSLQVSTDTDDILSIDRRQTLDITNGIYVHRTRSDHFDLSTNRGQPSVASPARSQDDLDSIPAREKVDALPLGP